MVFYIEAKDPFVSESASYQPNFFLRSDANGTSFKEASRDFSLSHKPCGGFFFKIFISQAWEEASSKDKSGSLCSCNRISHFDAVKGAMIFPFAMIQLVALLLFTHRSTQKNASMVKKYY